MNVSNLGLSIIQRFEKCWKPDGHGNYTAYPDSRGIWTVGWGSTRIDGRAVHQGDVVTQDKADSLLKSELAYTVKRNNDLLGNHTLNQSQFDSLISFGYNLGVDGAEAHSTLLKKVLANPNDPTIKDEFIKWRNKGSSFEKGILRRRLAEAHLYFTGEIQDGEDFWAAEIKQIMGH